MQEKRENNMYAYMLLLGKRVSEKIKSKAHKNGYLQEVGELGRKWELLFHKTFALEPWKYFTYSKNPKWSTKRL